MLKKIVIRNSANSGWLVFTSPVEVLITRDSADVLDLLIEIERRVNEEKLFAAGYISYEAASGIDSAYVTKTDNRLPLICFSLFAEIRESETLEQYDDKSRMALRWQLTSSRDRYVETFAAIKRQIELGNTYQINYTVRESAANVTNPWELFLRTAADAPYAAFIDCDDHAIVSASPELFFHLNDEHLISKPMKGTAQRGLTTTDDIALGQGLFESEKNRAENVMITDMVRNDIGRVAKAGSVHVPNLFEIEKYPTVWQMTSTVSANTKASVSEIIQALFPCASVTGAPKVSSMKIIADLEDTPREIYTGAIGMIAPNRQARFNVAIRTAYIDKKTNEAIYGVGGGIVWDSDPNEEYQECLAKAKILSSSVSIQEFELLETMLWCPKDGFVLLNEHLSRLGGSAEYFDFVFDLAMIEAALASLVQHIPKIRHRIRILLQRDGQLRMTYTPISDEPEQITQKIALATQPIDINSPFIYHKTTLREIYEQALQSASDTDDVLLWNPDGFITETSIANVIVRIDGELYTPPIECGLLAGTYRELLLRKGEVKERKIHLDELSPTSELTLINSVRGKYAARLWTDSIAYWNMPKRRLIDRSTSTAIH